MSIKKVIEIQIASDGLGGEITIDGKPTEGVKSYTIQHECGKLASVSLTYLTEEVRFKGAATRTG